MKIFFSASHTALAQKSFAELTKRYGQSTESEADYLVALGGDGHTLGVLYESLKLGKPVFAIRRTDSVGFLCNDFDEKNDLTELLKRAQKVILNPLRLEAKMTDGSSVSAIAINEVTIMRQTLQAVRLRISVDGIERIAKYTGDGVLVSTPTGSTAYNRSCKGPIMPLNANTLIMTGINGHRPSAWSFAVLPQDAVTEIEVLEAPKRPAKIEAGNSEFPNAAKAKIWLDRTQKITLLFDPDQHLGERMIREQFML